MRVVTVGVCSSWAAHRIMARDRSPLDMYGRNELLAKSPSPTTTRRNGRGPGGRPGHVPSKATASARRPGVFEAARVPSLRSGARSLTTFTGWVKLCGLLANSVWAVTPGGGEPRVRDRTPGKKLRAMPRVIGWGS